MRAISYAVGFSWMVWGIGWLYLLLLLLLLLLFISLVLMVWLTIDFCRAMWVFFSYTLSLRALTVANSQWFFSSSVVVVLWIFILLWNLCYLSTTHMTLWLFLFSNVDCGYFDCGLAKYLCFVLCTLKEL